MDDASPHKTGPILVTGITGLRNRGVEALVVSIVEGVRHRRPNAPVTVMTRTRDYDELRLAPMNVQAIGDNFDLMRRSRKMQWAVKASRLVPKAAAWHAALAKRIAGSSAVIASGGDVFSSDYGDLSTHLKPLQLAIEARTPFVLFAQSIGPFKRAEDVELFRSVAQHAALISVRETITRDYLIEKVGLTADRIHLTADPAFLLSPLTGELADHLRAAHGMTRERPTVAMSVSRGIEMFSGCDPQRHLEAWMQVTRCVLDEIGAKVLLVPHVQEIHASNNDALTCTRLHRALQFDPRVTIAGADLTAGEYKTLISGCDLLVAERMHAAIAGLSTGIATIVVGYSIKAEGILSSLLDKTVMHERSLISIADFLEPGAGAAKVRSAWASREDTASKLKAKLPAIKDAAESNYALLEEHVFGAGAPTGSA